jgi:hypothetical protein
VVKEESFNAENRLQNRATWKYDASYRPVEEVIYDADETETRRSVYVYDTTGNLKEQRNTIYGITLKVTFGYDAQGNMVEERSYNAEGVLDRRSTYKYDNKGNETEQQLFSADGKLQKTILYRNEYDALGNLIKKTQTDYGRDIVIVRREIQYY